MGNKVSLRDVELAWGFLACVKVDTDEFLKILSLHMYTFLLLDIVAKDVQNM